MSGQGTPVRAARVSSKTWNAGAAPRCFPSQADWVEWLDFRAGAHSPCEDCSSCYQRKMLAAGRCERPEVIFVEGEDGEIGISADDPRYACLLMGLSVTGAKPAAPIVASERFLMLLQRAQRRAIPVVKRAIDVFMRRVRRGHVGDGE